MAKAQKRLELEDILFVNTEIQKAFKAGYDRFNTWETRFVIDMAALIELETPLSKKQLFYLYKIYYEHIINDKEEFDDWCVEHDYHGDQ